MDRRKFLQGSAIGAIGLMFGSTMLDLANVKTVVAKSRASQTANVREVPLNMEDTPDLQPIGGAYHLNVEDLDKDILVIHVGDAKFAAVDLKCTHKGCDVAYHKDTQNLICPCHGSEYDLHGVVTKGPAQLNLQSYKIKLTDTEVVVLVPEPGDTPPANPPAPNGATPNGATPNGGAPNGGGN